MNTRVVICDDHQLFREGLKSLLSSCSQIQVVGEAGDGAEVIEVVRAVSPDVVLMDMHMPGLNGMETTRLVLEMCTQTKVIMLTVSEDEDTLFQALKCGVSGYLLKNVSFEKLCAYIRDVALGEFVISGIMVAKMVEEFRDQGRNGGPETDLTPREAEVLRLVSTGATNKAIAEELHISLHTVKKHLQNILAKLQLENRTQLTAYAVREG